ncbi:N-acetyltransferase family protein [Pseudarthrobacter sp. P1]|uniref:GNAT family N-acetyltransferase n=1 Tax=Pseudarthrobacter sp. P1 TaxID=3418418 RepID=UPI003CF8F57F
MVPQLLIRQSTAADAAAIARVHLRAWQESYAHLVPAAVLGTLDPAHREARWADTIADGGTDVWVAEGAGEVIGWATASAGRDTGSPTPVELEGLYVLASHQGTGAGQRLLDAAVGRSPAFLWVAADNPRAHAFYARNRFRADGTTDVHQLAGFPVEAVRLVRWAGCRPPGGRQEWPRPHG